MRYKWNKVVVGVCTASSLLLSVILRCEAGEIEMWPIPEDNSVNPQILNGHPATREDWPNTLPFTSEEGEPCTSTAVSETAIIAAAHCVGDNKIAHVFLGNKRVKVTCHQHPEYHDEPKPGNTSRCHLMKSPADIVSCTADIAVCLTDPGVTISTTAGKFERIKQSPPGARAKQQITLLGFGCVKDGGAIGTSLMVGTPAVTSTSMPGVSEHDPNRAYDEFIMTSGPAVCDGDSGGAAYSSSDKQSREIIGIAARGNISTVSYLVSVVDPRIRDWLGGFSDAKICGLDQNATNCRF